MGPKNGSSHYEERSSTYNVGVPLFYKGGLERLEAWDFGRLQALCNQPGHTITQRTWAFLAAWRSCARVWARGVEQEAKTLIRQREPL